MVHKLRYFAASVGHLMGCLMGCLGPGTHVCELGQNMPACNASVVPWADCAARDVSFMLCQPGPAGSQPFGCRSCECGQPGLPTLASQHRQCDRRTGPSCCPACQRVRWL